MGIRSCSERGPGTETWKIPTNREEEPYEKPTDLMHGKEIAQIDREAEKKLVK